MKQLLALFVLALSLPAIGFTSTVFTQAANTANNASQEAAVQKTQCAPGTALSGDLGYSGTECHGCVISGKHIAGEPDMEFDAEPILSGIRKGGPSDGKLAEGDVLVAIDGEPITTRTAAVHLSWLKPAEPVRLTVRRSGVLTDVEILPTPVCRAVTQPASHMIGDIMLLRRSGPTARGFLGLGVRRAAENGYMEVTHVAPDSPAKAAGLEIGDVITSMDGMALDAETPVRLRDIKPNQSLIMQILRGDQKMQITLVAGNPR